ncbi:MAG: ATP-binding protein [Polyangiaceae bacterium]
MAPGSHKALRPRFGFANRLFLALAALMLAVVGLLSWVIDRELTGDLVSVDLERQLASAQRLAQMLDTPAVRARGDTLVAARGLPIREFLEASGSDADGHRAFIERAFLERLETEPNYLQLRVLDRSGRERIRVERLVEHGAVRILKDHALQDKSDRDYFKQGMQLADGKVYTSPIELNREHGKVEQPNKPVVRTLVRVSGGGGALGLVILNVDLRPTLREVRAAVAAGDKAYVVNADGYFILHPVPADEFAKDLGGNATLKREFPQLSLSGVEAPHVGLEHPELGAVAVVPLRLADSVPLRVFTVRRSVDSSVASAVRTSVLPVVVAGLLAALVIAFLLARAIARPLEQVTQAVAAFPREAKVSLPTTHSDEVGSLARTFERMRDEVVEREAALELERKRFERLFEQAPGALFLIDAGDRVRLANARAALLTGKPAERLIGADVAELFPERRRSEVRECLASFRENEQGEPLDLAVKQGAGEVDVELNLGSVAAENDAAILMILLDVSRRNQTEANLKRSNRELEQFAYVASHDLQEPLRMVASYTELLARRYEGKLDEKADQYIRFASDGARRMQALVVDLLEFSRIETEGKPLEPVDTQRVVREVLGALAVRIKETQADIVVGELPEVQGDAGQLCQVFQNLISNALKFAKDGIPPRVHITARRAPPYWEFEVTDHGIGIPAQDAERVFKMFQRLHSRDAYPGSGIGLSITKRIIERHEGRIWLDPASTEGSTFRFALRPAERDNQAT